MILIHPSHVDNRSRIAGDRFFGMKRIDLFLRQPLNRLFAARHFPRRDDFDADAVFGFDLRKISAAFVLKLLGDVGMELDIDAAQVARRRAGVDFAHQTQPDGLGARNCAAPAARRTCQMHALRKRLADALTVDLQKTVGADALDFVARLIASHGVAHHPFHIALMFSRTHIDEIDDDKTADIAHAQLTPDFRRRLQIRVIRRQILIFAFCRMRRVHVDRRQRFGRIDHDITAARQRNLTRINLLDLFFDAETRKNRHFVFIQPNSVLAARYRRLDISHGAFVTRFVVDEDFVNRRIEVIAHD